MKALISAIQFLTILPVGKPGTFEPKGMVSFFPVVGLMVGALLCLFDMAVTMLWPSHVVSLLDVVFLAVVTGALHLDGLGDMSDGLYGNRPKEKALAIMKDSRIGAIGMVVTVLCLAVKWGGLMSLEENRALLLFIVPAYARGSMLFGFRFLEYGRPDGGTGHALFDDPIEIKAFGWLLLPVGMSVFLGTQFLVLNLSFVIITAATLSYYKRKIGCITGDMLGAMVEISEALLFLFLAAQI